MYLMTDTEGQTEKILELRSQPFLGESGERNTNLDVLGFSQDTCTFAAFKTSTLSIKSAKQLQKMNVGTER